MKLIMENWRQFLIEQEGDPSYDRHVPREELERAEEFDHTQMSGDPAYEKAASVNVFRKEFGREITLEDFNILFEASYEILDTAAILVDLSSQYMGTNYETGKINDPAYKQYEQAVKDFLESKNDSPISRLGKATMVVLLGLSMVPLLGGALKVTAKISNKTVKSIKSLSLKIGRALKGASGKAPLAQKVQEKIPQALTKLKFSEALNNPAFIKELSKRFTPEKHDYYIHIVTSSRSSGFVSPFTGKSVGSSASGRQKHIQDTGFLVGRYTSTHKKSRLTGAYEPVPAGARKIRASFGRVEGKTADELSEFILSATLYAPKKGDFVVNILQVPKGKKPVHFRKPLPDGIKAPEMKMRRSKTTRPEPISFDTYIPWRDANVVAVVDGTGSSLKLLDKVQ
jgi:hypothetical protein